jgi:hypothetical protein
MNVNVPCRMLSPWRAGHHLGTFDYLISGRQRQSDCDIKRPHDLESLEYGEDIVVYLEALTRRLPSEISAMGTEPPVSRAVPPRPNQTPYRPGRAA